MAQGRFTLGDRLGAKTVNCRIRGCTRTWLDLSGNPQLAQGDSGATQGMCEPCRKKFPSVSDRQEPCARPGCVGTWTLTRELQMEAFATNRPIPKNLCMDCEAQLASLVPREVVCSVPGCTRKAVLSPRQQLMGETGEWPGGKGPLCKPCADLLPQLEDRSVACGVQRCSRRWLWTKAEQLQAFAAGKSLKPPRRMCSKCREDFAHLVDKEVRCRASGCKNTWTWSREDQLDECIADKPPPQKAPPRLCKRCFEIWSKLEDTERPCRQPGCKNTWTDNRGAQLARILRGKTGVPHGYCAKCSAILTNIEDRLIPCKTEGCTGHWTWTRAQQLAAGVRPEPRQDDTAPEIAGTSTEINSESSVASESAAQTESNVVSPDGNGSLAVTASAETAIPEASNKKKRDRRRRDVQPPARHCQRCAQFLADKKTIEIPCSQCQTPIFWPPESQLQTALGNWEVPKLCGACKRDMTEAARQKARENLRRRIIVTTDTAGTETAEPAPTNESASSTVTDNA